VNKDNFEEIKENLAKTYQAIAENIDVEIVLDEFLADNFFALDEKIISNHRLNISSEIFREENLGKNFFKIRSIYDLAIGFILFNDQKILTNFFATNDFNVEETKIIKSLEKIRIINSLRKKYFGSFINIVKKIQNEIDYCESKLDLIMLADILKENSCDKKFSKICELSADFSKNFDHEIITKICDLKNIDEQLFFLQKTAEIIKEIRQKNQPQPAKKDEKKSLDKNNKSEENSASENLASENNENVNQNNDYQQNYAEEKIEEDLDQKIEQENKGEEESNINISSDDDLFASQVKTSNQKNTQNNQIIFAESYKIFTTKFDQVIYPNKLVEKNELKNLREQFDLKSQKLVKISKRMTILLKKKLLSKQIISDNFDSDGGVLNKKKLVPLILDAQIEDIWLNQKEYSFQNTALTILLDNSGSMRGQPIMMSAMASEIIASMLEKFMIKTEIIGFTTSDWKGGKAKKMWEASGRIKNPGRLNEIRHIIYKDFNQSLKHAKNNIALMLKEGILKENIDGEAILFAKSRLMQRKERRKILLVISDGNPVDDSTSSANETDILTNHLHQVIAKIENNSSANQKIEIVGIGIGHSTNEFYKNSITIKSIEELGDVMIQKIVSLL
jgi:cobaltochelatase CobT